MALLCLASLAVNAQTQDAIAHTLLVADYDYVCHTTDAQGEKKDVTYGLTLQVAPDMACTMGQKRHNGENDGSEQMLYAPTTWQNYPQGKVTSLETIPPLPLSHHGEENGNPMDTALGARHHMRLSLPEGHRTVWWQGMDSMVC